MLFIEKKEVRYEAGPARPLRLFDKFDAVEVETGLEDDEGKTIMFVMGVKT